MIATATEHILIPLTEAGYQAYIVGGSVRAHIFGTEIKDVDIVTDADEQALSEIFPGCCSDISKNMNVRVVLVSIGGYKYEIAHFRGNEKNSPHRLSDSAEIIDDSKYDAMHRDFTINALFLDAFGNIIDHVGGLDDAENRILRCAGKCEDRFDEDCLRIMRGIRFAVQYDLTIEEAARRAMFENCERLLTLPPERILDEMRKMMALGGKNFSRALKIMRDTGVLGVILPEVARLKDFEENIDFHPETGDGGGVLAHVLAALARCDSTDPVVVTSVLLHDVGKGAAGCYVFRDKGAKGMRHTYYGHDDMGLPIIEQIAERLKMPTAMKECAQFCAKNHMKLHKLQEMRKTKVYALMENRYFDVLTMVGYCDGACRGMPGFEDAWNEKLKYIAILRERLFAVANSVTGKRVLALTGGESGPEIGQIIERVKKYILDNNEIDQEKIDTIILRKR